MKQPPIWLLIFIAGFPLLSETVYTPSLPDIAHTFKTSESIVEYTLTIYLWGFALGTLFWGKISDRWGRKPCIITGLFIYLMGCLGCYLSPTTSIFMTSRLIQAFGGSVGSVLCQAVTRDAFHGHDLHRVYASIGGALSLFPALGPIIGGGIAQHLHWSYIFIFLILWGIFLNGMVMLYLPETHDIQKRQSVPIFDVAKQLLKDKKVITYCLLVAGGNGITFSYFAEGSFVLIDTLGFTPSQYGTSFIFTAIGAMAGGLFSKKIPDQAIRIGLNIVLVGSALLLLGMLSPFPALCIITAQTVIGFGICMTNSNALSRALVDYKWCIGTASSLFGFAYYTIISLLTFIMGWLHNGTLWPMPIYFLAMSIGMKLLHKLTVRKSSTFSD